MKRLLTYGLLLLTILASHFVVSACQDDLPETTEVMMTFTTRAVVSDVVASNAPDEDKMKDLRVIMLRENGTVVDNHLEPNINASSVTFTFTTPIQTGGEDFTFLAVANEESIQSESELSWLSCSPGDKLSEETITQIKEQQIGDGSAFNISDGAIPQTKQWTVHVPQTNNHKENQTLDFVASKISVQFLNHTMESQTLSNVYITDIIPNTQGYLFKQENNDYIDSNLKNNEEDVTTINYVDVTVPAGEPSVIQTYYTYPVDAGNVSSEPTLYATWNKETYNLPIKINDAFISSLPRNQHLQIVVTLTGEGMMYHVVNWEENPTNIGSPTPEGGYQVDGWGNGNDIIIGGEEPDTPVVPGDVIWDKGPKEIGWQEDKFELTDARIKNSSSICIVIDVKGNAHGQIQLQGYIPGYFNITNLTQGETDKHVIINTTQNNAPPDGSLILEGAGITLKKIYIPTTSE